MRTIVAIVLFASLAYGQAARTYAGRKPVAKVDVAAPTLPRSFAWYGDSIIAGFCNTASPPTALANLLNGYLFANMAQAGTTIVQIKNRYFATRDTACAGERCGTYLFEGGANNCHSLNSCVPETMISDMFSVIDDARGLGRRVVSVNIAPFVGCSPCVGPTIDGWALAKDYNTRWAAACAARPDITCIDVGSGTAWEKAGTDGTLVDAWSCDKIHWLQGGADALAAAARGAFP